MQLDGQQNTEFNKNECLEDPGWTDMNGIHLMMMMIDEAQFAINTDNIITNRGGEGGRLGEVQREVRGGPGEGRSEEGGYGRLRKVRGKKLWEGT